MLSSRFGLARHDQGAADPVRAEGGFDVKVMQVHAAKPELQADQSNQHRITDRPAAGIGDQKGDPRRRAEGVSVKLFIR